MDDIVQLIKRDAKSWFDLSYAAGFQEGRAVIAANGDFVRSDKHAVALDMADMVAVH